jgi:Ca2+/Na+ antiporter
MCWTPSYVWYSFYDVCTLNYIGWYIYYCLTSHEQRLRCLQTNQSVRLMLCFLFCFVCLRFVSCVQHILCCVFCLFVFVLRYTNHKTKTKKNKKNPTIYVGHHHTQDTRRRQIKHMIWLIIFHIKHII